MDDSLLFSHILCKIFLDNILKEDYGQKELQVDMGRHDATCRTCVLAGPVSDWPPRHPLILLFLPGSFGSIYAQTILKRTSKAYGVEGMPRKKGLTLLLFIIIIVSLWFLREKEKTHTTHLQNRYSQGLLSKFRRNVIYFLCSTIIIHGITVLVHIFV